MNTTNRTDEEEDRHTMTQHIDMDGVLKHLKAGTLVRNSFGGTDDQGRQLACLYSAIVTGATDTNDCPIAAMPQWMADLTPLINDNTRPEKWESLMLRYGRAAKRWHVLSTEQWDKIERLFKAECIATALRAASKLDHKGHDYWPKVQNACLKIETALRNNLPITREMKAEAEAAAAEAAAGSAAGSAGSAAAGSAAAGWAAAWAAAWSAARSAAAGWDHLCVHLLDLIEAETMATNDD